MVEIVITDQNNGQRVDKFVKKYLNNAPLSFIYKLFRKKDVKVNNHWVKNDYLLKENDVLKIYVTDEQIAEFNKVPSLENLKYNFEVIYEDKNILVINKPLDLLVHEDKEEKINTLSHQVLAYLYQKGEYKPGDVFKPSPAHRLDRNTSGVIVFGKNIEVLQGLEELFKTKENIEKKYLALVVGKLDNSGTINKSLIKNSEKNEVYVSNEPYAKSAITKYKLIKNYKDTSLAEIEILTGRTHQIRVHMSYINHPVVGDQKYGNFAFNKEFEKKFKLNSQFLHAESLIFKDIKGKLSYLSGKTFKAKLPSNFQIILDYLEDE